MNRIVDKLSFQSPRQESFACTILPHSSWDGPGNSGKSMGLVMAALVYLDRFGNDTTKAVITVPNRAAWSNLLTLSSGLDLTVNLMEMTVKVPHRGIIHFVEVGNVHRPSEGDERIVHRLAGLETSFLGVDDVDDADPRDVAFLVTRHRAKRDPRRPLFFRATLTK